MSPKPKTVEEALTMLRRAIEDEGPVPSYHRRIMRRHRDEWPTLWRAIDALLARSPSETTEERNTHETPTQTPTVGNGQSVHVEPGVDHNQDQNR